MQTDQRLTSTTLFEGGKTTMPFQLGSDNEEVLAQACCHIVRDGFCPGFNLFQDLSDPNLVTHQESYVLFRSPRVLFSYRMMVLLERAAHLSPNIAADWFQKLADRDSSVSDILTLIPPDLESKVQFLVQNNLPFDVNELQEAMDGGLLAPSPFWQSLRILPPEVRAAQQQRLAGITTEYTPHVHTFLTRWCKLTDMEARLGTFKKFMVPAVQEVVLRKITDPAEVVGLALLRLIMKAEKEQLHEKTVKARDTLDALAIIELLSAPDKLKETYQGTLWFISKALVLVYSKPLPSWRRALMKRFDKDLSAYRTHQQYAARLSKLYKDWKNLPVEFDL
jgi:hypothetical protein